MPLTIDTFIAKWAAAGASERANKDAYLVDLCDVLGVPRPDPTTGDSEKDQYVFERDARFTYGGGQTSVGKIDLYKAGCFILEAKQGSDAGSAKTGTARRNTPAWHIAMKDAYGQALGYARAFDKAVPFLVVADLGYCFDLYASFDGSWDYRPFPNAQKSRIFCKDLASHTDVLRAIFEEPFSLDPSKHSAKVTSEIAGYLADLARKLENDGHAPEAVATFLMRCLFTMFAEDVGLLPERCFTNMLRDFWVPNPPSFVVGVETLWRNMNEGGMDMRLGRILHFNGGLFASPSSLPLDKGALVILQMAAERDWSEVEPAIFGTLLERALGPEERHRLGAHYTPRAYVERLVRPTIEDPLRADWEIVRSQVRTLVISAGQEPQRPTHSEEEYLATGRGMKGRQAAMSEYQRAVKTRTTKLNLARAELKDFHQKLVATTVLDPACGTGNFLYVALDIFKRLEVEVLAELRDLGAAQEYLATDQVRVTPAQFIGIEVKRWAKEIAELVLWIGYFQWHYRSYGKTMPVPEPVLRDYKNIECRDAVMAYESVDVVRDNRGGPVTQWNGVTTRTNTLTGEAVKDETATVLVYRYAQARRAAWPAADFIVGNPPFIGNKKMRVRLGDGYTEALRACWPEVPESVDYVMYWWAKALATLQQPKGRLRRFGLITTNSIRQAYNRIVVERAIRDGCSILFAIPDHPWVDTEDGAAVRVSMTVVGRGEQLAGSLATVVEEQEQEGGVPAVRLHSAAGRILPDLSIGAGAGFTARLVANSGISFMGVTLGGAGFVVDSVEKFPVAERRFLKRLLIGRDLNQTPDPKWVVDFHGQDEEACRAAAPHILQHVLVRVKPDRDLHKRKAYRERWWLFAESRGSMRASLAGLPRFIATCRTASHRVFFFVSSDVLVESTIIAIALGELRHLGVLSSRAHTVWALGVGSTLEDRPRYNNSLCFETFPFPPDDDGLIAKRAAALDSHRRDRQTAHSGLTITAMYNVLEKLRAGEDLNEKEKIVYEAGLIPILRKIHDDLDAAVFDAYGWPHDLTDEQVLERLVALNKERAEEERKGHIRWLRPEFQNPPEATPIASRQVPINSSDTEPEDDERGSPSAKSAATPWPSAQPDRFRAVRDLVTASPTEWSVSDVAREFKGARVDDIAGVLETFEALGLLVGYDLVEGRRWRASQFVGGGGTRGG